MIEEEAYSPKVIDAVAQRLGDADFQVRGKALEYLTVAALQGAPEFEQIKQLQNSANQQIRDYAAEAILLTKYDFAADREAAEKALALGVTVEVWRFHSVSRVDRVPQLSSLFQLRGVQLENLPVVSGDNLTGFSEAPMLSELKLIGTEITGDGLVQLKHFSTLKRLWITESKLNDDDMQILANIPGLMYLDVSETDVTASGVNVFSNTNPKCEVRWNN